MAAAGSKTAWVQVFLATLAQAICAGTVFTAYGVIAAPLKLEFNPSNMVLMLGMTVISLCSGVLSPMLGAAVDRYPIRRLVLTGLGLLSAGLLLLSMVQNMVQAIVVYGTCMAVASVLLGPIATSALLARWFTARRALAMGIASAGAALGGFVFPPLLQFLLSDMGWRTGLQTYAIVLPLLTAPLFLFLLRDRPTEESNTQTTAAAQPQIRTLATREVLADANFWLLAAIVGCLFAGPLAIVSNLMQLAAEKQIAATQAAFLLSLFSVAGFIGKPLIGAIADRITARVALMLVIVGVGTGVLTLLSANSYLLMMVASVMIGFFAGPASLLWSVILAHTYGPQNIGRIMGLMNLTFLPLTLSSPPLFGYLFDTFGTYQIALAGYAVVLVVILGATTLLKVKAAQLDPLPSPAASG